MQQAMLYTFLIIMPLMLLSGLLTPVHNMPDALQVATWINPLRWGIDLVRRVYLEGAGFTDIWFDFLPLLAMMAVTLPLAAWLFRKDRKSVVQGKSVSVRLDLVGRRSIKQNTLPSLTYPLTSQYYIS